MIHNSRNNRKSLTHPQFKTSVVIAIRIFLLALLMSFQTGQAQHFIVESGFENDSLVITMNNDTVFNDVYTSMDHLDQPLSLNINYKRGWNKIGIVLNGVMISQFNYHHRFARRKRDIYVSFNFCESEGRKTIMNVDYKFD